jgi:assimilatory nitrate reductase electron transfer subunit
VTRRVAVVGAGMAAARLAQQLLALAPPGHVEVTLYGREPHAPYNRALLTDTLTGRYRAADLALPTAGATLRPGTDVVAVDPAARTLTTAGGRRERYDTLVLATGAAPVPLPGAAAARPDPRGGGPGPAHVLRSLADAGRLAAALPGARRCAVAGGGLLGVGVARALAARGLAVTLVHRAGHLMERHLDPRAGAAVARALTGMGVAVETGTEARAAGRTRLELPGGRALDADLVVTACGTRPRTALARAAGIAVRTGVVVDDRLATSAPHVYAIGDCAEHRGTVHGTAGPAWEQADTLAARLCGARPDARWTGTRPAVRLTAGPLEVAAFGDPNPGDGTDTLCLADATRGTYKALVMRGERLAGAVLVGDLATAGDLARVHERDEPLPPDPLDLLTTEGAHA